MMTTAVFGSSVVRGMLVSSIGVSSAHRQRATGMSVMSVRLCQALEQREAVRELLLLSCRKPFLDHVKHPILPGGAPDPDPFPAGRRHRPHSLPAVVRVRCAAYH